jgi:hypothetical protein
VCLPLFRIYIYIYTRFYTVTLLLFVTTVACSLIYSHESVGVWISISQTANGRSIMRAPGNLSSVPPFFLGFTTPWAQNTAQCIMGKNSTYGWTDRPKHACWHWCRAVQVAGQMGRRINEKHWTETGISTTCKWEDRSECTSAYAVPYTHLT